MEEIARFVREEAHHLRLIVLGDKRAISGDRLAQTLDDAARFCRDFVAVSWNVPGVVKWTRESKPIDIFISHLINTLKNITGRWLDNREAVLAEIAFDKPDIVDDEHVIWVHRQAKRSRAKRKPTDRKPKNSGKR